MSVNVFSALVTIFDSFSFGLYCVWFCLMSVYVLFFVIVSCSVAFCCILVDTYDSTSIAEVSAVKHFKATILLQTTRMRS